MAKGDVSTYYQDGVWKSKVEGSSRAAHAGGTRAEQAAVGRKMAKRVASSTLSAIRTARLARRTPTATTRTRRRAEPDVARRNQRRSVGPVMDPGFRRKRGEQIARRLEQLVAGQRPDRDDVRRAAQHNEVAYDSAAAAHERAAQSHDRSAAHKGPDQAEHEAAAVRHRAGRDADAAAGTAARARRTATPDA
jgi:Uncharacterized protein conserved in bacteria (DUF2188)